MNRAKKFDTIIINFTDDSKTFVKDLEYLKCKKVDENSQLLCVNDLWTQLYITFQLGIDFYNFQIKDFEDIHLKFIRKDNDRYVFESDTPRDDVSGFSYAMNDKEECFVYWDDEWFLSKDLILINIEDLRNICFVKSAQN
jgi:hypothetical protein